MTTGTVRSPQSRPALVPHRESNGRAALRSHNIAQRGEVSAKVSHCHSDDNVGPW